MYGADAAYAGLFNRPDWTGKSTLRLQGINALPKFNRPDGARKINVMFAGRERHACSRDGTGVKEETHE
jgi:hypothetical protein